MKNNKNNTETKSKKGCLLWRCYKDVKMKFDDILESEKSIDIMVCTTYYLCSIVFLPVFILLTLICFFIKLFNRVEIKKEQRQEQIKNHEIIPHKVAINPIMSPKKFKVGDQLYTVVNKSQVMEFYVDKIKYKEFNGQGIREYWCNCDKHKLLRSRHFGKWRCRHNTNLFTNLIDANNYLNEIKPKK